jgi:alginate O-acetyltransferase complex protein AlgI
MFFNSYEFLFLFLPFALLGYFALSRFSVMALAWLMIASLFFYAWWNPWHLPIMLGSIGFNFWAARHIVASCDRKRIWLWVGISGNLLLLGAFKYTPFVIGIIGDVSGWPQNFPEIALPLGISFFTFTQIAYLIDTARGEVQESHPVHYALFVTFFPHLLAGPIIHHKEMMPQFDDASNRRFNADNMARGLFLLALGFGKKVLIADPLGASVNVGYANVAALGFSDAWLTTLAYTFQIYFDFSGYTDMALGVALMFNIRLPVNFDSPYHAINIQDFWKRWHITLSRFLRDYLYIPLGGNRVSDFRVGANLMMTFLLGGLWHGAGWTFIAWGGMHGIALIVFRFWQKFGLRLPTLVAGLLTFLFVHITWIFFRAYSLGDAWLMLRKLVPEVPSLNWGMVSEWQQSLVISPSALPPTGLVLLLAVLLVALPSNSNACVNRFSAKPLEYIYTVTLFTLGILTLGQVKQFLYFNF